MAGAKPPKMQVGDLISVVFDARADSLGHARIRRSIEQDAAGIAQQSDRPICDNERADQAGKRVHPEPAERARQQQPDNDQDGNAGIGQDVNDRGPHIVVAVIPAVRSIVIVLFEVRSVVLLLRPVHDVDCGNKGVRFRNFVAQLQISLPILELK